MTMGKDSRIVRVEVDRVREREREREGEDCPGQGKAEEGNPVWCSGCEYNVFNRQTVTLDNCTCAIVQHSVGAIFPDLCCKRVSLSKRLLSLVCACVRKESKQEVL